MEDTNDVIDMSMEDYHNFILWFGCPPGSQVNAKSTIAVDFFRELEQNANDSDGSILLPLNLLMSSVGRGGEMMQKICHQLKLKHSDWQAR